MYTQYVRFRCIKFKPKHLKHFNENYYNKPDKTSQDNIISNLTQTYPVKKCTPRPVGSNKKEKSGREHFLILFVLPVIHFCNASVYKNNFLSVSGFSRTRLNNTVYIVNSRDATEERKWVEVIEAYEKGNVRNYIKKLRGTESHYSWKESKRICINRTWY